MAVMLAYTSSAASLKASAPQTCRFRPTITCSALINRTSQRSFGSARQALRLATWVSRRPTGKEQALPSWAGRSASIVPVPADLRIEVKPEDGTKHLDYDEDSKVVRIPLSALDSEGQRRSKLVLFTCNKCGGRTARLVNPVAWEKGVVFGQCSKCEVWHVLAANNKNIYEEVRYKEDPRYNGQELQPSVTDMEEDLFAQAAQSAADEVQSGNAAPPG